MTYVDFEDIQHDLHSKILGMTSTKGREYSSDADRLSNFKEVASDCGVTPEQALYVFLNKHMRAIAQYCRTGSVKSEEGIEGRVIDAILYLELLMGLVKEKEKGVKEV